VVVINIGDIIFKRSPLDIQAPLGYSGIVVYTGDLKKERFLLVHE